MFEPVMFRDRSPRAQIILAGVVPAAIGALAGVLVGASAAAYWVVAILAGVGALLSGFEHPDGWDAADRGFFGGAFYGTMLLIVHGLIGNHPQVSLGSFPPALAVITTVGGALLAAAGGRIGRARRAEPATVFEEPG